MRPVIPGDQCFVYAEITSMTDKFAQISGSIEVGKNKVAEAELFYSLSIEDTAVKRADPVIVEWLERSKEHGEAKIE